MRILEFIKQNCKNVEFHALGDIGEFFGGLSGKTKEDFKNGNAKYITYKNIFSNHKTNLELCEFVKIKENEKQNSLKFGDVLFTISSETQNECAMSSVICQEIKEPIYLNSFSFCFRPKENLLLPDFCAYLFRSSAVREKLIKTANGVTRFNVSRKKVAEIKIPVPSLEVQNKIVEVLDSFSSLVRSLVLEKTAREKQYKYYLNHLITNARNSRILKLGEVAKIITGSTPSKSNAEFYGGEIPFYKPADLNFGYYVENSADKISKKGYEISRKLPEKSILVTCIGATIGKVGFIRKAGICNQQINAVLPNENFIPEYIYFCLISDIFQGYIKKYKTSSTMPILNKTNFEKLEIPLPPLDEQERIVGILDSLNELANGLSAGIPKEIELRQKQYEYWRDRLLEFPSKDSK